MRKHLLVLLLALPLAACGTAGAVLDPGGKSVFSGGTSVTAPVRLSIKQDYSVETLYNSALKAFNIYKKLPRCEATTSKLCSDQGAIDTLRANHRNLVRPAVLKARQAQRTGDVNAINVAKDIIFTWGSSIPPTRSN